MKTNRCFQWVVFLLSGGFGWYQNIVAGGWFERVLPDWLSTLLFFAAIGGGFWAATHVGNDLENRAWKWMDNWWSNLHYMTRERKKKRVVKWLMGAVMVWLFPLISGIIGLANSGYE